jgi:hypothetical protein
MPTPSGPKLMSPQRFRVEEGDLPGERVSGIMDERPEMDSGESKSCHRISRPSFPLNGAD